MGSTSTESLKLVNQHNNRIIDLYRASLKYFKDDISLWKEYIKFLMKCVSKDILSLLLLLPTARVLYDELKIYSYLLSLEQFLLY